MPFLRKPLLTSVKCAWETSPSTLTSDGRPVRTLIFWVYKGYDEGICFQHSFISGTVLGQAFIKTQIRSVAYESGAHFPKLGAMLTELGKRKYGPG